MILTWYAFDTHDTHLILVWYSFYTHLIRMILTRYAFDTHLILVWYSFDTHLIRMILVWYSSDTRLILMTDTHDWYASDTHDTQMCILILYQILIWYAWYSDWVSDPIWYTMILIILMTLLDTHWAVSWWYTCASGTLFCSYQWAISLPCFGVCRTYVAPKGRFGARCFPALWRVEEPEDQG